MAEKEYLGIHAHGTLEGVDFTVAGNGTDDKGNPMKWDSSVQLNLSTIEKITKNVKGVNVETHAKRPFVIKLSVTTEDLPIEVEKWNKKTNQMLHIRLQPSKNSTFKVSE